VKRKVIIKTSNSEQEQGESLARKLMMKRDLENISKQYVKIYVNCDKILLSGLYVNLSGTADSIRLSF
jgi:hypothetical protein